MIVCLRPEEEAKHGAPSAAGGLTGDAKPEDGEVEEDSKKKPKKPTTVGFFGLDMHPLVKHHRSCSLMILVGPEFQNKGYGSRSPPIRVAGTRIPEQTRLTPPSRGHQLGAGLGLPVRRRARGATGCFRVQHRRHPALRAPRLPDRGPQARGPVVQPQVARLAELRHPGGRVGGDEGFAVVSGASDPMPLVGTLGRYWLARSHGLEDRLSVRRRGLGSRVTYDTRPLLSVPSW